MSTLASFASIAACGPVGENRPGCRTSEGETGLMENEGIDSVSIPWPHAGAGCIVFAAIAIPVGWRLGVWRIVEHRHREAGD